MDVIGIMSRVIIVHSLTSDFNISIKIRINYKIKYFFNDSGKEKASILRICLRIVDIYSLLYNLLIILWINDGIIKKIDHSI